MERVSSTLSHLDGVKRISVGWQDDQATLVFEDPQRVVTLAELNQLFRGSPFLVVDLVRAEARPGEPSTAGAATSQ